VGRGSWVVGQKIIADYFLPQATIFPVLHNTQEFCLLCSSLTAHCVYVMWGILWQAHQINIIYNPGHLWSGLWYFCLELKG